MSDPKSIPSEVKATVTTAWGEVKHFTDHVSAYIAVHPKTGLVVAFVIGNLIGLVLHV